MKVDEIRERFLNFFEQRGHRIYPSDSLVPASDPTLLFTGAGMNQFKDEFLGRVKGPRRAATCQRCLRTADLENVGKTPGHHTFFEMLGNFSFGDYFKKEAILWAWEFLTQVLGLRCEELWVSVYKEDDEAYNIWKDIIKVPEGRILKLDAKENFWPSNAPQEGPNGPCGPCSEIFYGGKDGIEVWNLVFTQFDRKGGGKLEPLPNKNIDTGMGLERIARVMQKKKTNFEIDSFAPIVDTVKELLHKKTKDDGRINAVADHIRAVTFAIADGVFPSNEERGYVIRKLIRKAFWYGRSFGLEKPFLYKIVPAVSKAMKNPYPELTEQREDIAQVILSEERRFRSTIQEGIDKLGDMISAAGSSRVLSGENVFKLYDTYGFPLELTQEIAGQEGIKVDLEGFRISMEEQRVKSRGKTKIKTSIFDSISLEDQLDLDKTRFMEDRLEIKTKVLRIISGDEIREKIGKGEKGSVFLKETTFYGEKGGQVGDKGVVLKNGIVVGEITDAVDVAGIVKHAVRMKNGILKVGDVISVKIDATRRENIRKNHTATHLLHNALRKVLGQHVKQAGSLVAPDRLRFDFIHMKALTAEEISRIEGLVNSYIEEDSLVTVKSMPFNESKKQGAIALFGEKYAEQVRMISVGDYSKELCGGTHVNSTGEIGMFRIVSESSIASGVRRIEAVTGDVASKKIKEEKDLIKRIASELKTTPDGIFHEIETLSNRLKKTEKELNDISKKVISSSIDTVLGSAKKIKGLDVIISTIKNADMVMLRKATDAMRDRLKEGVFVLLSERDGKLSMVVSLSASLKSKHITAVKILNDIGSGFGIKGGGRPDFAQAGGRLEGDLEDILKKAEEVVVKHITEVT